MVRATNESSATGGTRASGMKRLVIVADNSLIVEAIRVGFRNSGEFNLVGHADARRTSVRTIVDAEPDVILLDEMDERDRTLQLLREISAENDSIALVVLSVEIDPNWLEQVFEAGATSVISKSTHPAALATLVRETLNGHIYHRHTGLRTSGQVRPVAAEDLPLTDRELEILQLVASGSTNGEIARRLWVTEQTVKFHLRNVYRKLDVANRTQASHFAHVNGLVTHHPETSSSVRPQLVAAAS